MVSIAVVYTILLLIISFRAELVTRMMQEKLSEQSGVLHYKDEDEYWLYGLFYHNPNDRHFMVNARVGIGTTVNLALPAAKILMVFAVLLLASMPLMGIWCMTEEFTPIQTRIVANEITVEHTGVVYQEKISNIASAELLQKLPKLNKVVGTAMDHLLKGKFYQRDWGRCSVYLNPEKGPFLKLKLNNGSIVLIGGSASTLNRIIAQVSEQNPSDSRNG